MNALDPCRDDPVFESEEEAESPVGQIPTQNSGKFLVKFMFFLEKFWDALF